MSLEPWPNWPSTTGYIIGQVGARSKNWILAESIQANTRIQEQASSKFGGGVGRGWLHQSLTATMFLWNIFIRMMSCSDIVEFVYENGILMWNWAEFIYTKLAKKKKKKFFINLHTVLQIFLLVVDTSSQINESCLFFIASFSRIIQTIFLESKY